MTGAPFRHGDFVWCAFPEREDPLRPGPLHVAYAIAVARTGGGYAALVAYTTTRPWPGVAPLGIVVFTEVQAAQLGQAKAFVLDLRRVAYVPVTTDWFPRLPNPDAGVLGRASGKLRDALESIAMELATRRVDVMTRLGPLWRR